MSGTYAMRVAFAYMPGRDETMPRVVEIVEAVDEHEEDAQGGIPSFYSEAIERYRVDGFTVQEMYVLLPQAKVLALFDRVTVDAVTGPVQ